MLKILDKRWVERLRKRFKLEDYGVIVDFLFDESVQPVTNVEIPIERIEYTTRKRMRSKSERTWWILIHQVKSQ